MVIRYLDEDVDRHLAARNCATSTASNASSACFTQASENNPTELETLPDRSGQPATLASVMSKTVTAETIAQYEDPEECVGALASEPELSWLAILQDSQSAPRDTPIRELPWTIGGHYVDLMGDRIKDERARGVTDDETDSYREYKDRRLKAREHIRASLQASMGGKTASVVDAAWKTACGRYSPAIQALLYWKEQHPGRGAK